MIRSISMPPPVPDAPVFDPASRADAQRDWDSLFHAVMTRLSSIAAEPGDKPTVQLLPDSARRLRSDMRECVSALGQLHAWQRNTAARNAELEQVHRDLRWSLAWPRVAPPTSPDAVVPS